MKKVVVFNASPRKNGNTGRVLNQYLEQSEFENVEIINLVDCSVEHCTGCLSCFKTGECIIKDDMEMLYKTANQADVLIFTTPVYFNSVTSIGKIVIDRFQRNYSRRFIRFQDPKVEPNKKGVLIMTAGSNEKNNSFDGVRKPMDLFFKSNGIVGFEEILFQGLDSK